MDIRIENVNLSLNIPKKYLIQLSQINHKLDLIMANNEELKALVVELQATVDAEQAQIAALQEANAALVAAQQTQIEAQGSQIASLEAVIVELEAQIAAGASPAQLQEAVDALNAIKADIASTVPDAPAPEA